MTMNWLCGCGEQFRECQFWSRVMTRWREGKSASELELSRRLMLDEMTSVRAAAAVCRGRPEYLREVRELIERLFEASNAQVVIDSSKSFRQACILLATETVEMYVVHLVRDPRAVVHSLMHRPKKRLDAPEGSAMLSLDPQSSVGLWIQSNRQAEQLGRLPRCRYLFVRYEEFVNSPSATLSQIGHFVCQGGTEAVDVNSAEIPLSHTISGNPDRLRKGAHIRRPDGLDGIDPSLISMVEEQTAGMLQEYGYSDIRNSAS